MPLLKKVSTFPLVFKSASTLKTTASTRKGEEHPTYEWALLGKAGDARWMISGPMRNRFQCAAAALNRASGARELFRSFVQGTNQYAVAFEERQIETIIASADAKDCDQS